MLSAAFCLAFVFSSQESAKTADSSKPLAALAPVDALVYFEWPRLGKDLHEFFQSSLWKSVQEIPAWKETQKKPEMKKLLAAQAMFEGAAQKPMIEALTSLTDRGAAFAMRPSPQKGAGQKPQFLFVVRSSDEELAERVVKAASSMAALGGPKAEIPLEVVDGTILLSNDMGLLRESLSRLENQDNPSLLSNAQFSEQRKALSSESLGWGFIDLAGLRGALPKKRLGPPRVGNAFGAFLFAGTLEALHGSEWASVELLREGGGLEARAHLSAALPTESCFVPRGNYSNCALPQLDGTIASLVWRRDSEQFWIDREKHVEEADLAKLVEFQTNMGLLFGGKNFESEILGQLGPRMDLLLAQPRLADIKNPPRQKFPAGVLVLELEEPAKLASSLQMAFQTAVGFANLDRGKMGGAGLLLGNEDFHGVTIAYAKYPSPIVPSGMPDGMDDSTDDPPAPAYHNVSPACAIVGNRFLLGSSLALVREMVEKLQALPQAAPAKSGMTQPSSWTNDLLRIDAAELRKILQANEESLVANNMLEKMHGKEEATKEIKLLLDLVGLFRDLSIEQRAQDNRLEHRLRITTR